MKDPFDDVLKALGLYEDVQNIPPATVTTEGTPQQISCRLRVIDTAGNPAALQPAPLAVRISWALKLIKFIHPTPDAAIQIRPLNIILILDGNVKIGPVVPGNSANVYPAPYRIPPSTISTLPLQERVWRTEKFALGILLYEIFTGHKPFEGFKLDDRNIQDNYQEAEFPQDLDSIQPLCFQSLIYACLSPEFGRYITFNRFRQYVVNNPGRFTLQVVSAVVGVAALITVPILGAVGFSAIGPVAGSAAAAWQASIGAVEAGSLFAIFQSAAMGGAAATGLTVTGVTGLAITGTTSGSAALAASQNLRSIFMQGFRRGP